MTKHLSKALDWNHIRSFVAVVESGSLSAGAECLNLSQPTLSRQMNALEQSLGVTLFERVGRGFTVTQSGQQLLAHAKQMEAAAHDFSLTAGGQASQIEGKVGIACTETTAVFQLPTIVKKMQQRYPAISVDIIASQSSSNLKHREADIAIRAFRPEQPDLVIRKIQNFSITMYATPEYLKSIGNVHSLADYKRSQFIGFGENNPMYLDELNKKGLSINESNFSVHCNNHISHWEMCKHGLGIGVMAADIGDKEPSVKRVPFHEALCFEEQLWLVCHRELRTSAKIKTVFDFLHQQLTTNIV